MFSIYVIYFIIYIRVYLYLLLYIYLLFYIYYYIFIIVYLFFIYLFISQHFLVKKNLLNYNSIFKKSKGVHKFVKLNTQINLYSFQARSEVGCVTE